MADEYAGNCGHANKHLVCFMNSDAKNAEALSKAKLEGGRESGDCGGNDAYIAYVLNGEA